MVSFATIGTSPISNDFIEVINASGATTYVGTLSRDAERARRGKGAGAAEHREAPHAHEKAKKPAPASAASSGLSSLANQIEEQ